MARIPDLAPEAMTEDQRRIAAKIASTRGGVVRGPFAIWLRHPKLAEQADAFGSHLRQGTTVPRRLSELAILVTARHWTAQYEWYAHEAAAREAGIADPIIEAIRQRRAPLFKAADEECVWRLCNELYQTRAVSEPTYAAARETLGEAMLIELVTIAGFYAMVALVLKSFDAPLPPGVAPPLPA